VLHLQLVHFTEDSVTLDMGILLLELLVSELPVSEPLVLELLALELPVSEPRITINDGETALVGAVFFYKRINCQKGNLRKKQNSIIKLGYI
jgi:hypothetical protein